MSIIIDEVVSEVIPPATAPAEAGPAADEPAREDEQHRLLRLLRHNERRRQRLLAD
jgi:hypothetical protein